ncbi:hypothetical protein Smp_136020 [Schistosoma mansoni]|uniref:hypothetical protein n=1 Tax=Schistosoma mansoni TaxID=6183 RepID=UPI0001A63898|nr:hypothetical protein Smp_136020 [Schistosoma mansoni]|eukprot:XP_018654943.1 hypothetical protein Smp_136020 [Schistosoma mansoni]
MNPTIPHMSTDKISTTSLGSMVKYCTDNYDESSTTLILSRLEIQTKMCMIRAFPVAFVFCTKNEDGSMSKLFVAITRLHI